MSNTDHTKNSEWTQVLAKVEQRRAARFVGGICYDRTPGCVTAMINQLKWEPLEHRRLTSRLVMFYKITHDLIDINAPFYLLPGDVRTRGANIYRQPRNDKDIYKFSFFPRTTTDTRNNYISQYHRELPYAAEFQSSCILHTLGPCLFVYSFNCSYAEGFLVVFDMRQCKITLKMSPALYQEEEEEVPASYRRSVL